MRTLRSHRGILAASILAMLAAGAARLACGQIMVINGQAIMMQQQFMQQGNWAMDEEDMFMGNGDYESRYQQQLRNEISNILQQSQSTPDRWSRRRMVEDGLATLGSQALPLLREQETYRTGLDLDAIQVAEFRIQNDLFVPQPIVEDWALDHFHFVQDLEKPPVAPPLKITRIVNLTPGNLLFPHHLFYVAEWTPTQIRLPIALATDGKIQTLENDDALARFLKAEAGVQHTRAGKELLASLAIFLSVARTDDLQDHPIPHTRVEGTTVSATLTAPIPQTLTLKFSASDMLESVASKR